MGCLFVIIIRLGRRSPRPDLGGEEHRQHRAVAQRLRRRHPQHGRRRQRRPQQPPRSRGPRQQQQGPQQAPSRRALHQPGTTGAGGIHSYCSDEANSFGRVVPSLSLRLKHKYSYLTHLFRLPVHETYTKYDTLVTATRMSWERKGQAILLSGLFAAFFKVVSDAPPVSDVNGERRGRRRCLDQEQGRRRQEKGIQLSRGQEAQVSWQNFRHTSQRGYLSLSFGG